tara:strand:- start:1272 stop:2093 length:822 start_codon:yes stop_codon:yes gene_type:complete
MKKFKGHHGANQPVPSIDPELLDDSNAKLMEERYDKKPKPEPKPFHGSIIKGGPGYDNQTRDREEDNMVRAGTASLNAITTRKSTGGKDETGRLIKKKPIHKAKHTIKLKGSKRKPIPHHDAVEVLPPKGAKRAVRKPMIKGGQRHWGSENSNVSYRTNYELVEAEKDIDPGILGQGGSSRGKITSYRGGVKVFDSDTATQAEKDAHDAQHRATVRRTKVKALAQQGQAEAASSPQQAQANDARTKAIDSGVRDIKAENKAKKKAKKKASKNK